MLEKNMKKNIKMIDEVANIKKDGDKKYKEMIKKIESDFNNKLNEKEKEKLKN